MMVTAGGVDVVVRLCNGPVVWWCCRGWCGGVVVRWRGGVGLWCGDVVGGV